MENTMSYRTILVHVDHTAAAAARIKLAAQLAARDEAHLIGSAMSGVPRFMYAGDPFDASGAVIAEYLTVSRKRAEDALARFDAITSSMGLASAERRNSQEDEHFSLCMQARYADLLVLGQFQPGGGDHAILRDLPQYVILHCGKPVLIVPYAGEFPTLGERPLIAWDGSLQAARAVAGAIPLLRRAGNATLAVFAPETGSHAHGEEPGADIALYLARHGVKVDVQRHPAPIDVGNAILSLAADLNADLLVMGAYGHSRLREVMVGGATRTVLETMTLPVLMAH
jgi:nucleotide-binding universal stress UspA family protein